MEGSRIHRALQDVRHPQQVGAQNPKGWTAKNKSRVLAWLAPKSLIQNYPDQMEQNYNLPFEDDLRPLKMLRPLLWINAREPFILFGVWDSLYLCRKDVFLPRVMWAEY